MMRSWKKFERWASKVITLSALSVLLSAFSASAEPPFAEVSEAAGLEFVHFNGMSGEFYFPENVGAGVAMLDFDGDGDLDLFLRQGMLLGSNKKMGEALFPPPVGAPPGDRLFRNDSPGITGTRDSAGSLRFVDVTEASGIVGESYGMGVAVGDYNGDGAVDLYLTNFGANRLWENDGHGRFTDVTEKAGVGVDQWSVSATFLDYDRDGRLDLYVANYVDFTIEIHKPCFSESSARDYCGPRSYNPQPDRLFHNRGDGTFKDVSAVAGIASEFGGALGVVAADFNLDGWTDIYVTNDQLANQLWINGGDGRFTNEAVLAGVAVNMDGAPEASMGVDAADFDNDGDEDLFLTHLRRQTNTIYVNQGDGWFSDKTLETGLAAASFPYTSFGTAWIDFDNDGRLDLFVANGAVQTIEALALAKDPYPLHQPNQLFRNLGNGRFEDVTARAGEPFARSEVSRGAAFGDLDNDGDTDVVLTNNNGPVRLLRNRVGSRKAWLGLRLRESSSTGDVLGARAALLRSGEPTLWRRARADGSYASANDSRILAGLGARQAGRSLAEVLVVWPAGKSTRESAGRTCRYRDLPIDRYITLYRDTGPTTATTGGPTGDPTSSNTRGDLSGDGE
ncbi:MAG: CRTAC1 family protein [Acidobacteria bacterium]|nr:CRTAC1 family protein [Acidobacteriota bacterium]